VQVVRVESLPTNLHLNVEPGSLEVNSKVAVVPITLPLGGLVMVVSGGVVSVPPLPLGVKVRVAGVVSILPAASLAHTLNVYVVPTVRLV
jgi:hypothetical protein